MRRSRGAAAAVLVLLAACGQTRVPVRLAGLHRVHVWTGARAVRMMAELHGADVAPRDSAVADYGAPGQLRMWTSRYPDEVHATVALTRMVEGMRAGHSRFSTPRPLEGAPGRWLTVGPGGHNVLWASGPTVYWLQGEPDAVLRAADELPPPSRGQLA